MCQHKRYHRSICATALFFAVAVLCANPRAEAFAFTPTTRIYSPSPSLSTANKIDTLSTWYQPAHQNSKRLSSLASLDNDDAIEPIMKRNHSKKSSNLKNHGVHPAINNFLCFKNVRKSFAKQNRKAMTLIVAAIIMISSFLTPLEAIAAPSGGRMGGSFGGSSRSSTSRSYSSPPSSYNRGFNRGFSSGYYSRPSITVSPSIGSYGYGYYGSPVLSPVVPVVRRGPSIVDVVVFAIFASVLFSSFSRPFLDGDAFDTQNVSALGPGVTVARISVALNVPDRNDRSSILNFLQRLSRTANTDSRVGISNLVSQVALELLRQKSSIFAADTEVSHFKNADAAQREFSSKAIQERSKFENESTNKYGGVDYTGNEVPRLGDYNPGKATSAVITLLISIDGDQTKFPQINSISDVEKALTRLATDVKVDDCLRSAELLWTPDNNSDVLSDRDVIIDYPRLRSV